MFDRKFKYLGIAAVMAFGASVAEAAPVSFTDLQPQTSSPETMNFSFGGLAASDGSGGQLILHARGDYDDGGSAAVDESLSWNAEGLIGATGVGNCNGTSCQGGPFDFVTSHQSLGNVEFQRTYNLSGALLDALIGDGALDITVMISSDVGFFEPPNYVEWTLNYNTADGNVVPLPAGLPMLLTALVGFGYLRRRKSAA